MADEDITLDGKPLHSLRVADLKAALEQRNLPKSGQKNTLIKRLKGKNKKKRRNKRRRRRREERRNG
uniref:SAP domain-containing protein n=1 Tax=Amphilophus citrinellus TaxID=61819 RepID=A0A3Q0RGN9_AMPCI